MKLADEIISQLAKRFFQWLHTSPEIADSERPLLQTGMTRTRVGELFWLFYSHPDNMMDGFDKKKLRTNNLEGRVMASLRIQKLMRSKRYEAAIVVCVFCNLQTKSFAPIQERTTARQKIQQERQKLRDNKHGIVISDEPHFALVDKSGKTPNSKYNDGSSLVGNIAPINEVMEFTYMVVRENVIKKPHGDLELNKVTLSTSRKSDRDNFLILQDFFPDSPELPVRTRFRASRIAAYRCTLTFEFIKFIFSEEEKYPGSLDGHVHVEKFSIVRDLVIKSGDPKLYRVLEAKQPYAKKKRHDKQKKVDPKDVLPPPKEPKRKGRSGGGGYKGLGPFRIPKHTMRRVETGEMEDSLVVPWGNQHHNYSSETIVEEKDNFDDNFEDEEEFGSIYSTFWQNLLWASELQAYEDIRLFDMEQVVLEKKGRLFKLYVSGLAEGRPSVLKGDMVLCSWKSKEYRGRVVLVEQLDVLLEFHHSFHKQFRANLDRLDRVRFTVPRTNFRTGHAGILAAPAVMKRAMLLPSKVDAATATVTRNCPSRLRWTSSVLNEEQKKAVTEIVQGKCRPLPYVIFGPPGTGKTTTLVEAIYQLAKLRNHQLKILVVAPSNDATDILVEKLSQYFPPSEMVRVLAYTRSIDQVPEAVRKYCTDGMEGQQVIEKMLGVQITVATINMAARLWCTGDKGLPRGHFDVLCVDEAGHATEPEVIAVASTVMDFYNSTNNKKQPGQIVLAGDPMQLGPIVTSELCKTFKMDRSYLERLVQTSPAYSLQHNSNSYPPHLVTLLVNNYRSHPDILKLPNEMFYRNQLIAKGDVFQTHSMAKWEHLPTKGFPILFHAVDGENTREGSSPSWFNPQEAMVVVEYVRKLVQESKPKISPQDIGIITPYARQVQKIRLALEVSNIDDVKVGSVETFQGQERRVIIISTVRSENSLLQHDLRYNLGFVANEKRFNVAVTRAKSLLIVVGNPRVLETDAKNWLPLLRFCKSKNSWMGEEWEEGLSSESDNDGEVEGDENVDKDEWAAAAQESYCFVNREE